MIGKTLLFLMLVTALVVACTKNTTGSSSVTCGWDSCALQAPASEIQMVKDSLKLRTYVTRQQCSGLFYQVIDTGTGRRPSPCSTVNVSYVGRLTDSTGAQFDAGTITLPLTQVIPGWRDGVPVIREGGQILLFIPPTLGYGQYAYQTIPGNSILYFKVILNSIQ